MPTESWRKMMKFSWVTMLLHSMKLGFFILKYLADRYGLAYTDLIKRLTEAKVSARSAPVWSDEIGHFDAQLDHILAGGVRSTSRSISPSTSSSA